MQNQTIHEVPSLISRDASTAIKGLLMLLIVFGHTSLLTTDFVTGSRTFLWSWLYTFHVYVFLILPFIYGYKRKKCVPNTINVTGEGKLVNIQQVAKDLIYNLKKIGVPYCWFFLFSAIIFVAVGGGKIDFGGMLYAFVFGNEPLMDKYIGFNFMWFMPAMLALMTMKSIWYNSKPVIKMIIVFVSITLWVLSIIKVLPRTTVGMYVPFAISQALYFIIFGLTARWLIEKQFLGKWQMPVVILLIGICTALLYYCNELSEPYLSVYNAVLLFMPILAFLFLYGIRSLLGKSMVLKFIGTYSLQVYLVHVYVLNVLSLVFMHFTKQSEGLGVVIYVLALIISTILALVMVKVPVINRLLFPVEK